VFDPATGRWIKDPYSDLTRNRRQQDVIRRVMKRAISQGARNPFKLKEFVDDGIESVALDDKLTINDVLGLGQRYRDFDPGDLKTYNLDVLGGYEGGQSIVTAQETARNRNVLGLFQGIDEKKSDDESTTPGPQAPGEVKVTVLNGSGLPNQATQVTQALSQVGFRTGEPGDAPVQVVRTTIQYPPGQAGAAQLVARHLAAGATLQPSTQVKEITVISGPDYTSVLQTPKPASEVPLPTTTTTTAPKATTTVPKTTTTGKTVGKTGVDPYNPDTFVAPAPPAGTTCN